MKTLEKFDVKYQLNCFYAKFNSVFRNFKNVSIETFIYLFNSYCAPEYGLALWNIRDILIKHIFKTFLTGYSNSLKRILGVPKYASSHITADICSVLLLDHHLALIQLRYFRRVMRSNNLIIKLNSTFLKSGLICKSLMNHFKLKYNVDIWLNDLDALRSRIS